MQEEQAFIVATPVPESARMEFLPKLFGQYFIQGENTVYGWMENLSEEYKGGYWDYYDLDNGGQFMCPRIAYVGKKSKVFSPNGSSHEVSDFAAGLIATMFALSGLAFDIAAKGGDHGPISEKFHLLRDFAFSHDEARAIISIVD